MHKLIIISLILLAGCGQKWCLSRFPPQVIKETETVTKIVYRDTTIYVHIDADTVYQEKIVYKTPEGYQTSLSELHTQFAWSSAQVVNGTLKHSLFQKETEIERVIKNAVRENSTHTVVTETKIHEVPYVTWWHKTTSRFTIVVLILIFGYLGFRYVYKKL